MEKFVFFRDRDRERERKRERQRQRERDREKSERRVVVFVIGNRYENSRSNPG